MEAAVVSLVEPGERVLVVENGRFGLLFEEIARRADAEVAVRADALGRAGRSRRGEARARLRAGGRGPRRARRDLDRRDEPRPGGGGRSPPAWSGRRRGRGVLVCRRAPRDGRLGARRRRGRHPEVPGLPVRSRPRHLLGGGRHPDGPAPEPDPLELPRSDPARPLLESGAPQPPHGADHDGLRAPGSAANRAGGRARPANREAPRRGRGDGGGPQRARARALRAAAGPGQDADAGSRRGARWHRRRRVPVEAPRHARHRDHGRLRPARRAGLADRHDGGQRPARAGPAGARRPGGHPRRAGASRAPPGPRGGRPALRRARLGRPAAS